MNLETLRRNPWTAIKTASYILVTASYAWKAGATGEPLEVLLLIAYGMIAVAHLATFRCHR
jgi:hypothetical protein